MILLMGFALVAGAGTALSDPDRVGAVMVAVAGLMLADLDLRFQRAVAEDLPALLRNPAEPLEESEAVADELTAVTGAHGARRRRDRRQPRRPESLPGAGLRGGPRRMRVLLDGRAIPDRLAGEDVEDGSLTVSRQRLYRLVDLRDAGHHVLTLEPEPGISGYAFTFG